MDVFLSHLYHRRRARSQRFHEHLARVLVAAKVELGSNGVSQRIQRNRRRLGARRLGENLRLDCRRTRRRGQAQLRLPAPALAGDFRHLALP